MDINWHQVAIRDRDGVRHLIPNSALMDNTFMRLNGKMAYRHMFECAISPGANLQLVKVDIEAIAGNVLTRHGWNAPGYSPPSAVLRRDRVWHHGIGTHFHFGYRIRDERHGCRNVCHFGARIPIRHDSPGGPTLEVGRASFSLTPLSSDTRAVLTLRTAGSYWSPWRARSPEV